MNMYIKNLIDKIVEAELLKWSILPAKELAQHFYGGYKYKIEKDGHKFKLFFLTFNTESHNSKNELEMHLTCGEDNLFKVSYYMSKGICKIITRPENFDKEFEIFNKK